MARWIMRVKEKEIKPYMTNRRSERKSDGNICELKQKGAKPEVLTIKNDKINIMKINKSDE